MANKIFNTIGIIIIALFIGVMAFTWVDGYYPATFIVDEVDYDENIIVLVDSNGFAYEWEGAEDWFEGDMVSAVMHNNLTSNITDDRICELRYTGWSE